MASIARGGMGEIYRARDRRRGGEVAIKILPARFAAHPELRPRFEREVRAVATLSHPNILAFHDHGIEEGTIYLVTELLEGETLRSRLARGKLPVGDTIPAALDMARGLAAAHDHGVIHRDFKPENLFLTGDGRVKILDFGLAEIAAPRAGGDPGPPPATPAGAPGPGAPGILGTVEYMAPEQIEGREADPRSDLFSFGAVLYEMVSGRSAFRRESAAETARAVLSEDPPSIDAPGPTSPGAFESIVRRCLAKDPARRYASLHQVALALEGLAGAPRTRREAAGPARAG